MKCRSFDALDSRKLLTYVQNQAEYYSANRIGSYTGKIQMRGFEIFKSIPVTGKSYLFSPRMGLFDKSCKPTLFNSCNQSLARVLFWGFSRRSLTNSVKAEYQIPF